MTADSKVPNARTRDAMAEVDEMVEKRSPRFASADEVLRSLKKPAPSNRATGFLEQVSSLQLRQVSPTGCAGVSAGIRSDPRARRSDAEPR